MIAPPRLFGHVLTIGLIVATVATVVPTLLLTLSSEHAAGEELSAWGEAAHPRSVERDRTGESPRSLLLDPARLASVGVTLFVVISFAGYLALALAYIAHGDGPYAVMTLLQLVVFLVASLAFA